MTSVVELDTTELDDFLKSIEQAAANPNLLVSWDNVVKILNESHIKFFEHAESPAGEKWPPLSPVTIRKKHGDETILVETGDMLTSLVDGGEDHIERREPAELIWGTSDRKAPYHMTGTSRMPQRAFVGFSMDEYGSLRQTVEVLADGILLQIVD